MVRAWGTLIVYTNILISYLGVARFGMNRMRFLKLERAYRYSLNRDDDFTVKDDNGEIYTDLPSMLLRLKDLENRGVKLTLFSRSRCDKLLKTSGGRLTLFS